MHPHHPPLVVIQGAGLAKDGVGDAHLARVVQEGAEVSTRPRTRNRELGCVWPGTVSREPRTVHPSSRQAEVITPSPSLLFVRTIRSPFAARAGVAVAVETNTARTSQTSHRVFM